MSTILTNNSSPIPKVGDIVHYIEAGNQRTGNFVRFAKGGKGAVITDANGHEITRALRDKDGKPLRFAGEALELHASSGFSVSERFEFLENFADMTIRGPNNALVVAGEGGLGKTFTLKQRFDAAGRKEQEIKQSHWSKNSMEYGDGDYRFVKGHSTPKALYRSLYENKENTVIFDDCDGVVKDATAVNLLKGALDSYDKRVISWLVDVQKDPDLPMQFEFKGKVIFLTNLDLKKLPQPLISRAMFVDLSMTHPEKIERMRQIAPQINNGLCDVKKGELIDFLEKLGGRCRDLNMRTFNKVCMVLQEFLETQKWQRRVEYLVTQG